MSVHPIMQQALIACGIPRQFVQDIAEAPDAPGLPLVKLGQGTSETTIDSRVAAIRKDGEPPTADELVLTLCSLREGQETMCYWGQSVAAALAVMNADDSFEVSFVERSDPTKPAVCFRRKATPKLPESDTNASYRVTYSVTLDVGGCGPQEAISNGRWWLQHKCGERIDVNDMLQCEAI